MLIHFKHRRVEPGSQGDSRTQERKVSAADIYRVNTVSVRSALSGRREEIEDVNYGRGHGGERGLWGSAHRLYSFLTLGPPVRPLLRKTKDRALSRNRREKTAGCWDREQNREIEREGTEGWRLESSALHKASGANGEIKHLVPGPIPRLILGGWQYFSSPDKHLLHSASQIYLSGLFFFRRPKLDGYV